MKRVVFIIILFCVSLSLSSQNNNFYYANGVAQHWEVDSTSVNIIVGNIENLDTLSYRLQAQFRNVNDEIIFDNEDNNIIINSSSLSNRNLNEIINSISISTDDIFFSYSKLINDSHIWLTNEVYVKLKDSLYYSTHILPVTSQQQNIDIHYDGDNEYRIVCCTEEQVITIANQLYDTNYVVYSTPDFYSEIDLCTSDEYYDRQWNLKNAGQDGGTVGVDIKAEESWNFLNKVIGEPGSNIKVAVIDDGVEEHDDLYLGGGVSKVLDGYTANGYGTGRPLKTGDHGQMCAGVIAAVHNNIGIAGVASNARIVPIRIFKKDDNDGKDRIFSNARVAKAIKKSWDDFACPILNNSWNFNANTHSDKITDAIEYVANNGRNGKGCFVVYSSGNVTSYPYNSLVSYPADLDCVMAVGAIDKNGIKWDYSNFGDKLDIVAPGAVPTIDRMGNFGHCDNGTLEPDYNLTFEGTSAACPHVAGVAALMLSVNPNLTRLQMTDIIKRTAQKVGGYNYQIQNNDPQMTWCPETGYGLVDAHMAVVESMLYGTNPTLNGSRDMYMCDDYTFTCDIVNQGAFSYEWSHSDNLVVLSADSNMVKVKPINLGDAWIKVNVYSESRLIRTLEINDITINESYIDNLVPLSSSSLHITQNMTLSNNNHYLVLDAIVEDDVTLTITGSVYCSDLASIKVKPGGKLIVDGGKLTSVCETSKWQGIEVWGIDSLHQQQVNGQYLQGHLELKNGATIENAVCAVELWNPLDNHGEGGIVHATDAIFRNNAKAIHACNYANYNPATNFEVDYNSSFNNCSFVIDSNYVGEELFLRHIELINVSSFKFHGCSFSVDKSVPQVSLRPYGIVANNSGLSLSYYIPEGEFPLPGGNFTRNSFEGFETGIYVTNSSQYSRTVSVEYSDFSNNAKGLLVQNTGYATINNNNFIIGYDADCSFGLYLDRVSYFDVEENTFIGNANYGSDNYGVMVRNSASYNDISRNTFRNLQCGNVSLGKNYVTGSKVGLTYTCNTNINNINDFCIFKEDGIGGISPCQGSFVDPAGNTFSGSNYHICNDGENTISYYYQANNNLQRPVASKLYNVNAVGSSNISSCGIGNIQVIDIMSIDDIVTLENAYNTTLTAYNALLQINSQSAETNEDVEAQLLQLKTEYLNTVGEIVKFYLQQEEKDYEELREWLVKSEDIFSDRMLVASFIQEGNYDDAMTYATMLPKIHNLKGEELQDHNDYMKLIDLYIDLHETNRSTNQLTDAELTMVKNISDNGIGTSQMMAESILLAMGEPSLKVPQCLTMPPALIIFPQARGAEQSYVPFPTENAQWSVCDDKYSLHGDTIIDGIRYSKVYKQTSDSAFEFDINKAEYFCAIRNDVENKRVYGVYRNTLPVINANGVEIDHPTKEMLLYDFSINIGDTVSVVNFDEVDEAGYISYVEFVRVEALGVYIYDGNGSYDLLNLHDNDSIVTLENGELRRRMLLNTTGGSVRQYWIEGIGSNEGPFVHDMYGFLEYSPKRLLCYKENDDYLYYQDEFDVDGDVDCFSSKYYAVDIKENDINNNISIYPNPADDNITIELSSDCHTIEIYDCFGRMMMSQQVAETLSQQVVDVDISKYPSGLYLVVVKDDNERYYKRVVKN